MKWHLKDRYPNIWDMHMDPLFHIDYGYESNSIMAFWNRLGARALNTSPKFVCAFDNCDVQLKMRNHRRHLICKRHLHQYLIEVQQGLREPVIYERLVAVQ